MSVDVDVHVDMKENVVWNLEIVSLVL